LSQSDEDLEYIFKLPAFGLSKKIFATLPHMP